MSSNIKFYVFLAILLRKYATSSLLSKTDVTTNRLVREAGYPIEEHQVTTEDGYILVVHRIPYSPKNEISNETLPIAFFQHGVLGCSTDWVGAGPDVGLAYLLSDEGFDIWLGNSRGTRYSDKHIKLNREDSTFWDFSYHEMGIYDLPAIFHYISEKSGLRKLRYFGHSQGATEFYVLLSTYPEYNDWIISAFLLAPVGFTKHIHTPYIYLFAPIFGEPNILTKNFGAFDLTPNTKWFQLFGQFFCNDYSILQSLCTGVYFTYAGDSNYFNASLIPFYTGIYPAGASIKQFIHYVQNYKSGHFRPFDYGSTLNLRLYHQKNPPDYKLNNIVAPLYIYYCDNDFFATADDILHLMKYLQDGVVKSIYKVPPEKWNHIDFIYGMDLKKYLYDKVMNDVRSTY